MIFTVIDATFADAKRKPEKIQAYAEFEPLTFAILVQHSTNWANKPTGSGSLNWFIINPWEDDDKWKSYMRWELQGEEFLWKKIIFM